MLKTSEIKYIIVQKYSELSIAKIWPLVKEVEDLNAYFPDMKENELPEREYLWTIVSTLRSETTKELIKTARNNRTTKESADQNNLIQIDMSIYQEISAIAAQKRKFKLLHILIKFDSTQRKSPILAQKVKCFKKK